MFLIDKRVIASRYRGRRTTVVSILTLLGLVTSAQAAIPAADPSPAIASASTTPGDSFGTVLSMTELRTSSGKVGWLFTVAETDILVSLLNAAESPQMAARNPQLALATEAVVALPIGRMLAGTQATLDMAAAPTARTQLAALDVYSQMPELANRVLQTQSAAVAIDSSLRYLCADRIYADLYPNGTGWNNHAYSECRPGGALDPNRPSSTLASLSVHPATPPGDPGPGFPIIPCGGSIANISSMTIGPDATMPTLVSSAPTLALLSSFTSLLGRGHR